MATRRETVEIWNAIESAQGFTSINEMCRAMNISPATVYNYINNKTLPSPTRIGGRRLFANSKLKKHLAELTEEAAS